MHLNCLYGIFSIESHDIDSIFSVYAHDDMTARLRQFVKDKKFELKNFSTYGLENVLAVPRCKNDQVQSISSLLFQLAYY